MLFTLFLFDDDRSLVVHVVDLVKHVEKRWIVATIDADFLELVPEVILDWLLFKAVPFQDDIVFPLENETIEYEVFLL